VRRLRCSGLNLLLLQEKLAALRQVALEQLCVPHQQPRAGGRILAAQRRPDRSILPEAVHHAINHGEVDVWGVEALYDVPDTSQEDRMGLGVCEQRLGEGPAFSPPYRATATAEAVGRPAYRTRRFMRWCWRSPKASRVCPAVSEASAGAAGRAGRAAAPLATRTLTYTDADGKRQSVTDDDMREFFRKMREDEKSRDADSKERLTIHIKPGPREPRPEGGDQSQPRPNPRVRCCRLCDGDLPGGMAARLFCRGVKPRTAPPLLSNS